MSELEDEERTSGIFMRLDTVRVLLITDPSYGDARIVEVIRAAARVLPKGSFGVQLRDKESPPARVLAFAAALRAFTTALDVPLVMNGHLDMASGLCMDGVHLSSSSAASLGERGDRLPSMPWTSVAAHSDADVVRAIEADANAALVSPIFDSGHKVGRGTEALSSARALVRARKSDLRVIALGGIDAHCARACFDAGADGVAVMRALLDASDIEAAARAFDRAIA